MIGGITGVLLNRLAQDKTETGGCVTLLAGGKATLSVKWACLILRRIQRMLQKQKVFASAARKSTHVLRIRYFSTKLILREPHIICNGGRRPTDCI